MFVYCENPYDATGIAQEYITKNYKKDECKIVTIKDVTNMPVFYEESKVDYGNL